VCTSGFAVTLICAVAATADAQVPDSDVGAPGFPSHPSESVARPPDSAPQTTQARQTEVATRGARVMPFDLERTRHAFDPTSDGGVLTVTARDPSDTTQVRLVREHLESTSAMFARGDFSDPAYIHGDGMPGLAELRSGYRQVDVTLARLDDGARIAFTTRNADLVNAIHRWFAAQTSDHGAHARP
jgi:hypothetical protein